MKFPSKRQISIALVALTLYVGNILGGRALQNTDIGNLSMLSDSTLVSLGRMRKPSGIGYWAFDSYIRACQKAGISPQRISQTIGYARASAGYHAPDGFAHEQGHRLAYTCALDISVRGLTRAQIHALVAALGDAGFVAWFRTGPAWVGNNHIHCVFVGYPMKAQLRSQVSDALRDRDGLAHHRVETFYKLTPSQKRQIRALYTRCSLGKKATLLKALED